MINKLQILVMCMSLIDLTATYLYVSTFHSKFPQLDYTTLEANPVLRTAWKTLGLNLGMIIGGLVVFTLLSLLVLNISNNWQWFFCGTLSMMIIYHALNFMQLAALKPTGAA